MVKFLIGVVALAAFALALCILLAGPGARFGVWDYSAGLKIIRTVSAPAPVGGGVSLSPIFTVAALALIGAVAAFALRWFSLAPIALIAALAAGAAGMVPVKMKQAVEANPFIHDITTDFANPPAILAAADLPRKNPPEYLGDDAAPNSDGLTVREAQATAFPDIAPLYATMPLADATARAKTVIDAMGMEILAEGPGGAGAGDGWRIEAVYTSTWFGFKDDFIVRLAPEGDRVRIDLRSKSRVGGSDLGANAARVRDFIKRFNAA
ncbi:MAG: DUF1499 domain-containing protein [Parvularculaceae bacterium]|nr:DUF1499 domain-containing protein [Parvularculaceae bacterium]